MELRGAHGDALYVYFLPPLTFRHLTNPTEPRIFGTPQLPGAVCFSPVCYRSPFVRIKSIASWAGESSRELCGATWVPQSL